jgi:putative DNA modification/repair radical SAM protein
MELMDKVRILSGAARYDVSCASSGSRRRATPGGLGDGAASGICHSWSADGRCVSLLKILLSNRCTFDCAYCVNRRSNDVPRAAFTPEEVVRLTLDFYRRNCIEGLFLSSGVDGGADATVERMIRIAADLRRIHRFNGYIHLKMIPGVSPDLVRRAGRFADRLSVNIELPSEASLCALAPEKSRRGILGPMTAIGEGVAEYRVARRGRQRPPPFAPAGHSTQMIVGASPESDRHILALAESLYQSFALRRVYYSAYSPVNADVRLPVPGAMPPLLREHRLYQADWLLRHYGFRSDEVLSPSQPHLDLALDPKAGWAVAHPEWFPVDLASAPLEALLRVPGIGVVSARRILVARRAAPLRFEDLRTLGVVLRRARHFIVLRGRRPDGLPTLAEPDALRQALVADEAPVAGMIQPDLFSQDCPGRLPA